MKNCENTFNKIKKNFRQPSSRENSVILRLIFKFNNTIQNMNDNELLLQSELKQVALILESYRYKNYILFLKDVLNRLINLYEITNSIRQDIENFLTCTKLKVLHPSLIKLRVLGI